MTLLLTNATNLVTNNTVTYEKNNVGYILVKQMLVWLCRLIGIECRSQRLSQTYYSGMYRLNLLFIQKSVSIIYNDNSKCM